MAEVYSDRNDLGWIALQRAIRTHHIVGFGQPVKPAEDGRGAHSRAEAWIDLIMLACHKTTVWMNKGRKSELQVGELPGAYSYLAKRWNWTVKTVRNFLEKLLKEGMMGKPEHDSHGSKKGKQSSNQVQVLSVCNYSTYQVAREIAEIEEGQAKGKRRASEGHESNKRTIKEVESPNGDMSSALPNDPQLPGIEAKPTDPVEPPKLTASIAAREAFDAYNRTATKIGLPVARTLTNDRKRSLALRVKEAGGLDGFAQALANLERSAFLQGQNDRRWRADLDWLCQPSSFIRLLEGGYGNGAHAGPPGSGQSKPKARVVRVDGQDMLV